MIVQKRLREVLRYNKRTGVFTRIKNGTRTDLIGSPAGTVDSRDGYVRLCVDGRSYLAHRLAWLYVKGVWPKELDHEDTNRANNRWRNLRIATRSKNRANSTVSKNTKSGIKGVRLYKPGRYQARILDLHLGYFPTAQLAQAAYAQAAKKHFGEFARAR